MRNALLKIFNKLIRGHYPLEGRKRSRKFLCLQMRFVKYLKYHTGWKNKRLERALKQFALFLDVFTDNYNKFRNPFCFLKDEGNFAEDRDTLMDLCTIQRPLPYRLIISHWNTYELKKIDEGSYGDVYSIIRPEEEQRILKVVLAHGFHHDSPQTEMSLGVVIPDAICSRYLSYLQDYENEYFAPNFPVVHRIHLVDGTPPDLILEAWVDFRGNSENNSAQKKPDGYSIHALYLILEMEYCGTPFFNRHSISCDEAMAVLLQTTSALAVAEQAYEFEHRDLHSGNLLCKETSNEFLEYKVRDRRWIIRTQHLQIFIIDFTMSRINADGKVTAMDLSCMDYERDVPTDIDYTDHNELYGVMHGLIGDDFRNYTPRTNIIWLKYVIGNLFTQLVRHFATHDYILTGSELEIMIILQRLAENVLHYRTAMGFLLNEILRTPNDDILMFFAMEI